MSSTEIPSVKADNIIYKKMAGLLSMSYTDTLLSQSLEALDSRIKDNTAETRRYLRSTIEAEVLQVGTTILRDFENLAATLETVGNQLAHLNESYNAMDSALDISARETMATTKEAGELLLQQKTVDDKRVLLDAFEKSFMISDEEAAGLTNPGKAVDEEFFATLERVKEIYANCQTLLVDDNNENGMAIMNEMAAYLDKGYDKLYYSLQHSFKMIGGGTFQITNVMRRSLITLAERPSLLESALYSLYDLRAKHLHVEFVNALTVDTESSKALDFYAYDILRYVGDIMAWIHSASLNEQENLYSLFDQYDENLSMGLAKGAKSEPWKQVDTKKLMHSLIDKVTTSLIKPTRLRIEKSIMQEKDISIIYQLYNILHFYEVMFEKYNLTEETSVGAMFEQLQRGCMTRLQAVLEDKISIIKNNLLQPPEGLQPPEFLYDALVDLKSILNSYQTSISYSVTGDPDLHQLLENLTEPYFECCSRIASDLPDISAEIFLVNCYDLSKVTLALFSVASHKVTQLDNRIDELADALVGSQYRRFYRSSGLENIDYADKGSIQRAAVTLDNFLPAATMESSVLLHPIASPRLASSISLRASRMFADKFKEVRQKVDSTYGEQTGSEIFPRSTQEVHVLLALD